MKPMNSNVLNEILDKLVKIGEKRVKKSETMLNSLNIKDDLIKIAARQIVVDPIEKKLRTGYISAISREAAQFTILPTEEKDDKKRKPRFPGSAMSKYPSGSETTAPYVGEQHGGDQIPAASTLARRQSKMQVTASLKDIIQELKQENQIFVDVRDIVMRLNQADSKASFDIENTCKTLADEGITLIRTAEEQLVPVDSGEQLIPVEGPVEAQPEEYGERLEKGKQIEMEHKDTIQAFRTQLQQGQDLPDEKIAEMIATDHLKENPAYYDEMMQGEQQPEHDLGQQASLNIEAKSVAEIKDDLAHARESRSYAIERMEEKGLTPEEKERYQKTKTKWEKTIDRLDRELSRAMKQERKQEREEEKEEKEVEQRAADADRKEASILEGTVIVAQDPMSEPTFETEKFLSPTEYQELQSLIGLREKAMKAVLDREARNMQEGKEGYAGIDYSEIEVLNAKIRQYQNIAKGRKGEEALPEPPAGEMPPAPESARPEGIPEPGGPERGVLEKRPVELPEFASQKGQLVKTATIIPALNRKWEATPIHEVDQSGAMKFKGYAITDDAGRKVGTIKTTKHMNDYELQDEIAKMVTKGASMGTEKRAVTCQDFPEVCKNCRNCVIPSGYRELTFLDHRDKPFCSTSDSEKNIGFRWSYMRECRGYDPILKEVKQKVDTPGEVIFQEFEDKGEKPILKKSAAYEDTPKSEPKKADESDIEKAKRDCPKCYEKGFYKPIGAVHPAHAWHTLWNISWDEVNHCKDRICMPKNNFNFQTRKDSGENQFDTEKNRIVNDARK